MISIGKLLFYVTTLSVFMICTLIMTYHWNFSWLKKKEQTLSFFFKNLSLSYPKYLFFIVTNAILTVLALQFQSLGFLLITTLSFSLSWLSISKNASLRKQVELYGLFLGGLFALAVTWEFLATGSVFLPGGDDSYFFYISQVLSLKFSNPEFMIPFLGTHPGYIYLLGSVDWVLNQLDPSPGFNVTFVLFHYCNWLCSWWTYVLLNKFCSMFFADRERIITLILYASSPFVVLYSGFFLRDLWFGLFLLLSVYSFYKIRLLDKGRWPYVFLLIVAVFLTLLFRVPGGFLLILSLIAGSVIQRLKSLKAFVFWMLLGVFFLAVLYVLANTIKTVNLGVFNLNLEAILLLRNAHSLDQASSGSLGGVLYGLPIHIRAIPSILYFLLFPLPPFFWSDLVANNFSTNLMTQLMIGIINYVLLPFYFLGIWAVFTAKNSAISKLKPVCIITILFFIALSLSSVDLRHKSGFVHLFYMVSAVGISTYFRHFAYMSKNLFFFVGKAFVTLPLGLYTFLSLILLNK